MDAARDARAVLFDLDDTLLDRRRALEAYCYGFASRFARELAPVDASTLYRAFVRADGNGYKAREAAARELLAGLAWREPPPPERIVADWREAFPACARPRPGMRATLEALRARGLKLGVITNGVEASQRAKLDVLGVGDLLDAAIVSEAVAVAKPDRRIFELAVSDLGVAPEQAWFVGDHPRNDVLGAAAAGLTAVWLRGAIAWPGDEPAPALAIDALPELPDLIAEASA